MGSFWVLLIFVTLYVVNAEEKDGHHHHRGEYGHFSFVRKALCERNDEAIYKDFDKCMELEPKLIEEMWRKCMSEVYPDSNGKVAPFKLAACKDKSLFFKMDDCMGDTRRSVPKEERKEAFGCYHETLLKHDLGEIVDHIKAMKARKKSE